MRKQKGNMTLRRLFLLTSYRSIVLSIVLICIISYVLLSGNSTKFAIQAGMETVQQKNSDIDTTMRGLEVTIRDMIYSPELQAVLSGLEEAEGSPYLLRTSVNQMISRASNSLYMIDNIAVFSQNGGMIGSMFEFDTLKKAEDYAWYERAEDSDGETIWLEDSVEMVTDNFGPHMTISAVKRIRSVYATGQTRMGQGLGYVFFTLNLDSALNFGRDDHINRGRRVFVVSGESCILGGNDAKRLGEYVPPELLREGKNHTYVEYDGGTYLLTYEKADPSLGWYTVCLTQRGYILQDAHTAIVVGIVVSLVLLAAFWYLSVSNAEALSRPIKRLEEEFQMVEHGDFDIKIQGKTGIAEVDNLFSRFHVMAYRLDNLIHEVYEAGIKEQALVVEARQAQLQSLQMQINPHFLYNTLDSINWMALMEGNEDVSRMILALGHLFRNNMSTTGIYTTAREEIENVKLYMYLEQVRFGGRLDYQVDVEEALLEEVILKHILQPLVENSIKYGIEPYHEKGMIFISMKTQGDKLSIIVSDSGKGMAPETLGYLRAMWDHVGDSGDTREPDHEIRQGVGNRNIMKRLWLCYGSEASFVITSSPEQGTRTELTFPKKSE